MSTDPSLAHQFTELIKQWKNIDAIEQFFADDAVSQEPPSAGSPEMPARTEGKAAIKGRNEWWLANHEIHGGNVKGPFPHDDSRFCLIFEIDVTAKEGPMKGVRIQMEEVALYSVANGKIVAEEFFYDMTDMAGA